MSTTRELHHPQWLAGTFIAIPILFFGTIAVVGPFAHFTANLFVAWTIAAAACGFAFTIDRKFMRQFSISERLAILAGNGLVALLVATMGFMAFGG